MRPYAGRTISIAHVSGSEQLAQHLETAFTAAGWKSNGIAIRVYKLTPVGLTLEIHSADDANRETPLRVFLFTLNEIGITPEGVPDESVPEGEFRIVVGARPN
jgi:hypothetical protein